MESIAKETIPSNLDQEMRQSYLAYAMSVIVGRALPDVRDGLKPVHRRVLYAMAELGNDWNKAYKKSARVVGDVIGKYHPHGDVAVYDTIVRMAQDFSMRYPTIDGQGNFGSVDGDSPAAMRYTEIRLAKIAHELLSDIDKETVDFGPNYDETETQPLVLPTRLPNLLVNGSSGIAVGMATNIPPHNLTEVVNACIALIDDDEISVEQLMEHVSGPDFPTAGIINGSSGIRSAYRTGRGKVYVRARTEIEEDPKTGRQTIIVTELPYQVNKARLLEKIAELVKTKRLEGISELRDESDKSGMRMVIELKRGEIGEVVLNNLYQHTQMQNVFGINMVALIENQPKVFNLKELLDEFVRHRREVVTRRTIFELKKARDRAHVLEGLAVALSNVDPVIQLIKTAESPADAKRKLVATVWRSEVVTQMLARAGAEASRPEGLAPEYGLLDDGYHLSEVQAQAILDLRLHRLTALEQDKIRSEYAEILGRIEDFLDILGSRERLMNVIREELIAVRDEYGDGRRTEIVHDYSDLSTEDLIAEEDVVVTLSHAGYAKAQSLSEYRSQRRGGRGKSATSTKDEDFVDRMFVANTHDTILCFSNLGKVYWMKVYQLPQAGRGARGRPLINLLPLQGGEKITTVLPVKEFTEGYFVFMAASDGTVKKTPLKDFSRPRSSGIIAIDLKPEQYLVGADITDGHKNVLLFTDAGKSIRFAESDVRSMGRTARGVRGIMLKPTHRVISLIICAERPDEDTAVLVATENGYGKRTRLTGFPRQGRGGQGVIAMNANARNGRIVAAEYVGDNDEVMLITNLGTLIRTTVDGISIQGRNTQGVRVIGVKDGEHLSSLERIEESGEDNGDEGEGEA
ncbi:MAG: DNA gyrase subunit A [Gammaproteobacteria bacterium]|nr:DNA gyrase subunit A [Gammaproteobacteria bacterium]